MASKSTATTPMAKVSTLVSGTKGGLSSSHKNKQDEFVMNEDEARAVFQQSLTRPPTQQYATVESLHRTYHQYPNKLALTSSVVRQGLDQFQKVLLSQENTTGVLSEDDFVRGLAVFQDMINAAENKDEILGEIESMAVQIAGHNPTHFSDLLHLPEALNNSEIEGLMASMEGKPIRETPTQKATAGGLLSPVSKRSSILTTPSKYNNDLSNTRQAGNGVNLSSTSPLPSSPSGKITSSIKRVSVLSSTAPR